MLPPELPNVRLLIVVEELIVTVTFASIITSSPAPGTPPPQLLQFTAVSHAPLPPLHVHVAAKTLPGR